MALIQAENMCGATKTNVVERERDTEQGNSEQEEDFDQPGHKDEFIP